MQFSPDKDAFVSCYEAGKSAIIWTEIPADLLTPVSVMLKLKDVSPYHMLCESVEDGAHKARYSMIALDPDLVWKCVDGQVSVNRSNVTQEDDFVESPQEPFEALRALISESQLELPDELPAMSAGVYGYMGYDMVKQMERLPDDNPDELQIPDSIYMRPGTVVVFDSVKDIAMVVASAYYSSELPAQAAYNAARSRLLAVTELLQGPVPEETTYSTDVYAGATGFTAHMEQSAYEDVVERAKDYIRAGDIFQIVPSRRLSMAFPFSPFALYRSLRRLNPSPYLFYAHMNGFALVGSSPEILVKCDKGDVTIRPLAGTRKRGKTPQEDLALEKELLADEKECAEHLMLLDLGRNDVGRVAKAGTVEVTEQMVVERYSHVMHISSNVVGKLREDKDAIDALIAGFPAGTLSGAPKIRAMEIIDELETHQRSFYGGTVGYFSSSGDMDTCIMLRTALVKDGVVYAQAGAGVVADSVPQAEFQETEDKARAIIEAARYATKYL